MKTQFAVQPAATKGTAFTKTMDLGSLHQARTTFVASANRSTFHRPDCEWAAFILMSYNLLEFSSHQEAVEAGYKPCKTCRA